MESLLQDLRFAGRTLLRPSNRSTFGLALLTLAVSIGVATAAFSIVEAVLLRRLPFADPASLVSIRFGTAAERRQGAGGRSVPTAIVEAWRRSVPGLSEVSSYATMSPVLLGLGETRRVFAVVTTSSMFSLLGAKSSLGRIFSPAEDLQGTPNVVILSERFRQEHFTGDTKVVGKSIRLGGNSFEIVGVMPTGFRIPNSIPEMKKNEGEIWIPMGAYAALNPAARATLPEVDVIGRLRTGITRDVVRAQVDQVTRQTVSEPSSSSSALDAIVVSLHDAISQQVRRPILLVLWAAIFVLFVACANVANLLISRALTREREIAVRLALGAKWSRITQQLLTESVLLATLGGALGVVFAYWAIPGLLRLIGNELPDTGPITLNVTVLAFAFGTAAVSGLAFGLATVWHLRRTFTFASLKEGSAGAGSSRRHRAFTDGLVMAESAVTMILVAGTILFTKSFIETTRANRGFRIDRIAVMTMFLPRDRYSTEEQRQLFARNVLTGINALPGVAGAAVSNGAPIVGGFSTTVTTVTEQLQLDRRAAVWSVSPTYFDLLGVRLVRGAPLNSASLRDAIWIDEAGANALFGKANPLGQHLAWNSNARTGTIVGVVANTLEYFTDSRDNTTVATVAPHVYAFFESGTTPSIRFLAHVNGDVGIATRQMRDVVSRIDPDLPVDVVATLSSLAAERFARDRFLAFVASVFGTLALVLSAAGVFAVVSYATQRRVRELGIRVALGAIPMNLIVLTMRRSMVFTAIGIALGIAGTFALGGVLRTLLFEVGPSDSMAIASAGLILLLVAALASYIPGRRAARANPLESLRSQ